MRHHFLRFSAGALAAAIVLTGSVLPARAAESPLVGKWKITLQLGPQQFTLWLVKTEIIGGQPRVKVLSTGDPNFKDSVVEKLASDGKRLDLTFVAKKIGIQFPMILYLPAGEKPPKKLLGSTQFRGQRLYAWMEKTDLDELDPKTAVVLSASRQDLQKAMRAEDKVKAFQEVQAKYPSDPFAQLAATMAIVAEMAKKDKDSLNVDALKSEIGKAVKSAALYGPEMKQQVSLQLAGPLAGSKSTAALGLEYALAAEKGLDKNASYEEAVNILNTEAVALRTLGKKDDAAKVDMKLDQEFLKKGIPFKPVKYAGRASKSDRVVMVELFTGVMCPPCVAADVAFDALITRYKSSEVVFLEYHLHIPGPDPLTNKETEARAEFYGEDVRGTPTIFIDGKVGPAAGGDRSGGKRSYDELHKAIDKQIEEKGDGSLKVTATRQGDKIDVAANVADLQKMGKDVLRLRFVLVEDVVHFAGRNGQRYHHHVVRAFPGGIKGFALEKKTAMQSAAVSLKDLSKDLTEYLEGKKFNAKDRPLDLKHLKVIAFIQDDKSKEILQAAQIDVTESKERS